jgi:hypothetical protein
LSEQPSAARGQLSPDGFWWWDGARWVSAVSPDGRWRWDGEKWVVHEVGVRAVGPVRYEPTPTTRQLQRALIAYLAVSLVVGAVSLPFTIQPTVQAALRNAQSPLDQSVVNTIVTFALIVAIAVSVVWQAVLIVGTWSLWRWVYYVLMALGALGAFSILSDGLALGGVGASAALPAWSLLLSLLLALVNLGLAVWLFVLWLRYHAAWARRAVPA